MKRGPSKGSVFLSPFLFPRDDANVCVLDGISYIQQLEDRITMLESNALPAASSDSSSASPSNTHEPHRALRSDDEDEAGDDGPVDSTQPKKKPRRWPKRPDTPDEVDEKPSLTIHTASDDLRRSLASPPVPPPMSPHHSLPSALETLAEHACRHDKEPSLEEARVAVRSCLEAAVGLALLVTRLPLNGQSRAEGGGDPSMDEDLETLVESAGFCLRHYSRSVFGETARGGVLGPHPLALGK
jgi:hypothetical protein